MVSLAFFSRNVHDTEGGAATTTFAPNVFVTASYSLSDKSVEVTPDVASGSAPRYACDTRSATITLGLCTKYYILDKNVANRSIKFQ
jgi:hypothetical protein